MATKRIEFTEWLPDQSSLSSALTEATNVVPVGVGYAPFPAVVNLSSDAS